MASDTGSIQGFRPKKFLDGRHWSAATFRAIISNSKTLKIGTAVKLVGGAGAEPADANSDKTAGYVIGFETPGGIPVSAVANNSTIVDGTYAVSSTGDTYTAASDNETVKNIVAVLVPAIGMIVSGKCDANLGTTAGSNLAQYYVDIETTSGNYATLLDESTALTSIGSYMLIGAPGNEMYCIDPEAPATADRRVLCVCMEVQLGGDGKAQST